MSKINQSSVLSAWRLLSTARAGLTGLFLGFVERWRHRQTMATLYRLDLRQLEDLGMPRNDILRTAGLAYRDVKAALTGREALGSTALGNGIAMPHAISPACCRPALSLISLATPIDFDAPDHRDVDVVFALMWPQHRAGDFARFSILANRILSDPAVVDAVRQAGAPSHIRRLVYARSCALRPPTPLRVRAAGHVSGLPHP